MKNQKDCFFNYHIEMFNWDYFKYTQKAVNNIYSGAKLNIIQDIVHNEFNQKVLKFSNRLPRGEINKLLTTGYVISEISANQIVYWFDKDKLEGY